MDENDPERRLWQSVLIQAIVDASNTETAEGREAAAWIESRIGVTAEDFRFACEAAGVLPERVREFYRENKETLTHRSLSRLRDLIMKESDENYS